MAAYLKWKGFVGIGLVISAAKPVREVLLNKKPLLSYPLERPGLGDNCDNPELSEYVALVDWIEAVEADDAKWKAKSGLYTTPLIKASLDNQPNTVSFLEASFNLSIKELLI